MTHSVRTELPINDLSSLLSILALLNLFTIGEPLKYLSCLRKLLHKSCYIPLLTSVSFIFLWVFTGNPLGPFLEPKEHRLRTLLRLFYAPLKTTRSLDLAQGQNYSTLSEDHTHYPLVIGPHDLLANHYTTLRFESICKSNM